MQNENQQEFW